MYQKVFILINLLLITSGAYFGVSCVYRLAMAGFEPPVQTGPADAPDPPPRDPAVPSFAAYRVIVDRNLFRTSRSPSRATEGLNLDELQRTNLKLKLWGTVTGDASNAFAVIEDSQARTQKLYRSGDEIQGARVKLILRGKVVLALDGEDQILEMQKPAGTSSEAVVSSRPAPVRPAAAPAVQRRVIEKSRLNESLGDPSRIGEHVRMRPHLIKGRPAGYRISGIHPNSVFNYLGLRNGDVLEAVNGNALSSLDDAMGLYQKLLDSQTLRLEIERLGKPATLEYRIE